LKGDTEFVSSKGNLRLCCKGKKKGEILRKRGRGGGEKRFLHRQETSFPAGLGADDRGGRRVLRRRSSKGKEGSLDQEGGKEEVLQKYSWSCRRGELAQALSSHREGKGRYSLNEGEEREDRHEGGRWPALHPELKVAPGAYFVFI